MGNWGEIAQRAMDIFNILIIAYFFAGNGIYTILMLVSLGSALVYNHRLAYQSLQELRNSPATPPVTVVIPAFNEEDSILETVRSALRSDYPGFRVIVVDDGSTDETLARLIREYQLLRMDLIDRSLLPSRRVYGSYVNPEHPQLMVITKENGGKADALNAGINFCRSPYFCILDADCVAEPDALLRLMRPIVHSPEETLACGGIIRVRNGCKVAGGRIERVNLPPSWIEKLQVVEYLRSFLFGRLGWDLTGGTLIVSGAMAMFPRRRVVEAGGFSPKTVSEDMELIVRLRRQAAQDKRRAQTSFILDTICWTECPSSVAMLARQRRRWQLGLCQTLQLNFSMLFNWQYGSAGLVSFPFHLFIEGLGSAVEFIGYLVVPLAFALHLALLNFYIPLIILSLVYASFLSVGAVLVEELTYRRYPARRDFFALLGWSVLENFGFRQMIVYFRFQGFLQFLAGLRHWEKVAHTAAEADAA
ncbi:MAG: glycosyltransferase family 2 protein [Terriglobia bacterium]